MILTQLKRPRFTNKMRKSQRGSYCVCCTALLTRKEDSYLSVPGTNEGSVLGVLSAAKKIKPDQPQKLDEKKYATKHVTADQRVEKYGKDELYHNNNLLMCK